MNAYGDFYKRNINTTEFLDQRSFYWSAAKILETELVETMRFKYGKGSCKYYNYMLIESMVFFKFVQWLKLNGKANNDHGMQLFLSGCFYLGKGQADRPYMHFQEALDFNNDNDKVQMIRRIWSNGGGILVLTFFHNSTSYVASTREAILIDFVGIENVTNVRKGSYWWC